MTHIHLFLALASFVLIAVVVVQDHLVPALQQKSISSGLTGPYHWYLDASFVMLAVALVLAFSSATWIQKSLAIGAGVSLVLTGASGTWTDNLGPNGEKIHSALTAVTFVLAIILQLVSNTTPGMWGITGLALLCAGATHFLVANASVTEKIGVLGLCGWLIAYSL